MRDLFFILTAISIATAAPLLSPRLDLFTDSGSDSLFSGSDLSSGSDLFTSTLDDSPQPLLLAGASDPGTTTNTLTYPPGYDPTQWNDVPWSVGGGDSSWTGVDRPSRQPDGSLQTPEDKFIQGEKGQDYEANYGTPTVSPDVGGPTSFDLSPDQVNQLISVGVLVVGGVTWVYDATTKMINSLGGNWIPGGGF